MKIGRSRANIRRLLSSPKERLELIRGAVTFIISAELNGGEEAQARADRAIQAVVDEEALRDALTGSTRPRAPWARNARLS